MQKSNSSNHAVAFRSRKLASALLCGTAALVACAATAHAQSQPQSQPKSSATSVVDGQDDIIVTATKRSERLLDLPAPVSVLTANDLSRIAANKLADITSRVPGLNLISDRPGETNIILRGITTGSQVSSTVATYIDETAYGSSTSQALGGILSPDLDPSDVQRIEVLKGPQGTLYGANSLGGLVKYVTTPPDLATYHGRLELDGSTVARGGDGFGVRGMINIPLVKDRLAFRASGYFRRDPGFIDNSKLGLKDVDRTDVYGGRAAVLWRPDDRFEATLTANIQNLKGDGFADEDVTLVGGKLVPTTGDLVQVRYTREPLKVRYRVYSANLSYDLGFASFVSVTSYSTLRQFTTTDQTTPQAATLNALFGPGVGFSVGSDLSLKKWTEEARLQSPTGAKLEWRLGFFYDHEDTTRLEPSSVFVVSSQAPVALPGAGSLFFANLFAKYEEYAGFGDITYHFTPQFNVSAGIRYSSNDQKFREVSGGLAVGPTFTLADTSSDSSTTFQVSAQYKVDPNNMLYVRAATGYRPGGPNAVTATTAAAGVPLQYKPDTLTNYDLGYKASLFDRRVTIDFSAFYIDWRDIQITTIFNGITSAGNGGAARSKGAEFAMTWAPVKGLSLLGNVTYTDARLTENAPGVNGKDGDRLPNVPKWAATLSGDYDFALTDKVGAFVGASVRYVGDRSPRFVTGSPATYVRPTLPSFTTVDLRAGVNLGGFSVEIYGKNIGDERGFNNISSNNVNGYAAPLTASLIAPRTIGISFKAGF
jgi:iron complex outermembrane receptor protein